MSLFDSIGNPGQVPVVVLAFAGTGLATVRGLAAGGMPVYAVLFASSEGGWETRYSLYCKTVVVDFPPKDEDSLYHWLDEFARSLPQKPIVIPTSDQSALFLAKYRIRLEATCRLWATSHEQLRQIVSKEQLYRAAARAGVDVPPMLVEPTPEEVVAWCVDNPPPYFVKPFYADIDNCDLKKKNQLFFSREKLARYTQVTSSRNIIIQRMIPSGDGHVYDAYGLCNKNGEVVTLASHRRIRQYPPDTGATSYGEIPVLAPADLESEMFKNTRLLLANLKFHGIFGIEWLRERGTGRIYLADFNARPFSSVGHLLDCGLNLPLLAYQEIISGKNPEVEPEPRLKHRYWIDFNNDLRGFRQSRLKHRKTWASFVFALLRCRSFAYFDFRDPGPGLHRGLGLLNSLFGFIKKRKGAEWL